MRSEPSSKKLGEMALAWASLVAWSLATASVRRRFSAAIFNAPGTTSSAASASERVRPWLRARSSRRVVSSKDLASTTRLVRPRPSTSRSASRRLPSPTACMATMEPTPNTRPNRVRPVRSLRRASSSKASRQAVRSVR